MAEWLKSWRALWYRRQKLNYIFFFFFFSQFILLLLKLLNERMNYLRSFFFAENLWEAISEWRQILWISSSRFRPWNIHRVLILCFFLLDYSTVDIEPAEITTQAPAMSDMAALGNTSSNRRYVKLLELILITSTLPIITALLNLNLRINWMTKITISFNNNKKRGEKEKNEKKIK